jgi:hypothetical protein
VLDQATSSPGDQMRPQATRTTPTLQALSLGVLLVPVLFLALFAVWSYRVHYREARGVCSAPSISCFVIGLKLSRSGTL